MCGCVAVYRATGYIGTVDDVAETVLFLADNSRARFVTGASVVVDGGITSIGGWANNS